jgi:hypothetical protein
MGGGEAKTSGTVKLTLNSKFSKMSPNTYFSLRLHLVPKSLNLKKEVRTDWLTSALFFSYQVQCQNFIRVIAKTDKNRILICGTHAFRPRCRYYKYKVRNQTKFYKIRKGRR